MTNWSGDKYYDWNAAKQDKSAWRPCYDSHKPLKLIDDMVIYGGSCSSPVVKDADVYIGFDAGMPRTVAAYPWSGKYEVYMHIKDRGVPKDVEEFKAMVGWTIKQLKAGKKVHAGCIGGHGRTGLFFSALVFVMLGKKDAIQYVRDNYCSKVVESKEQVDWLVKHFGMNPAKPRDDEKVHSSAKSEWKGTLVSDKSNIAVPVNADGCIFGRWL